MPSGEAAEQVVNMTVKGVEVAANITGRAALSLATFLIAAIKNKGKSKGKTAIKAFDGKPTKVFVLKAADFKTFAEEAKQYGILYAAVIDKKHDDGLVDVIVNAKDAARVNRIAERYALSAVDIEKIQEEQKAKGESTTQDDVNKNAVSLVKSAANENVKGAKQDENPIKARKKEQNLSAHLSDRKEKTAEGITERKSVRKWISEIKKERRRDLHKPKLQTKPLIRHKQPKKKRKTKSR